MKISLRIKDKGSHVMESIKPTTVSGRIAGITRDGRAVSLPETLVTIGEPVGRSTNVDLADGSYHIAVTLENYATAKASFSISKKERDADAVSIALVVDSSVKSASFEKYVWEGRKNFSLKNSDVERSVHANTKKHWGLKLGKSSSSTEAGPRALDVKLSPDANLLKLLASTPIASAQLSASALGAFVGAAVSRPNRHTKFVDLRNKGIWEGSHSLSSNAKFGNHFRRFLAVRSTDGNITLTTRPDLESDSNEEFLVFFEWSRTKSPTIKAKDPALDALLRYQAISNLSAAQEIVNENKDRLADIDHHPLFCLAAAYLLPHWQIDQKTLLQTLPWLRKLQTRLNGLPDPFIIESVLMLRRRWNEIYPNQTERETWQINNASRTARDALARGVPTFKFGFYHFASICDALARTPRCDEADSTLFARGRDMIYELSNKVNSSEICTTLQVGSDV